MSKRFLDVFCVSFLFNIVMIIVILFLYKCGYNLIEDTVGTLLFVSFVSITSSYIIYKQYISSINSLSYILGATNTGNMYKKALLNISKDFQERAMEIYAKVAKAETKSIKEYNEYLYLKAYVNSRNELIEDLVKAFDEIDNLSIEELDRNRAK